MPALQIRRRLQRRNCFYCSVPPSGKYCRDRGISAKQRDERQAAILVTHLALRDNLLHLLAQLAHGIIQVDRTKQFHETNPVMRGERLVGTRVELPANLIDEIPERGHQRNSIVSAWMTSSNPGLAASIFHAARFVRPAQNEYMLSAKSERARDKRCR
jgi:hypothetical protein